MIAGHLFTHEGQCSCGRNFADVSGAKVEHVGQLHWAHTGALTYTELLEIHAEVSRLWHLVVSAATGGASVPTSTSGIQ